ncbi:MAG: hypothetical protein NT019_01360 [Candidatus Adlerbacteria bacterium]|nr:hypothetical protein [Candidatus Adlerbacteria bacterium]
MKKTIIFFLFFALLTPYVTFADSQSGVDIGAYNACVTSCRSGVSSLFNSAADCAGKCVSKINTTPPANPAPAATNQPAAPTQSTISASTPTCVSDEKATPVGMPDSAGKCPEGSSCVVGGRACSASSPNLTYVPLEPLPGQNTNGQTNFCQLINLIFKLLIYLGGMVAVLFLVLGGITYMISEVVNKKDFARRRIQAAVWGLLLLLSSYIILNTINPQLVTACNILNPSTAVGIATAPAQDQTAALRNACQTANGKNGVVYETGTNIQVGTGVLGLSLLVSPIGPLYAATLKLLGKDILTSVNPLDNVPATCAGSYLANSGAYTCKDIAPGELCLLPINNPVWGVPVLGQTE